MKHPQPISTRILFESIPDAIISGLLTGVIVIALVVFHSEQPPGSTVSPQQQTVIPIEQLLPPPQP